MWSHFSCRAGGVIGCLALALLLPQCGGGGTAGGEPQTAADARKQAATPADDDEPRDSDMDASNVAAATPEKPKGPSCDDGTCSQCGNGICPTGWYCDERASGGAACSWLVECADKPTCTCVTRVLGASCKCHEENGALKVACD